MACLLHRGLGCLDSCLERLFHHLDATPPQSSNPLTPSSYGAPASSGDRCTGSVDGDRVSHLVDKRLLGPCRPPLNQALTWPFSFESSLYRCLFSRRRSSQMEAPLPRSAARRRPLRPRSRQRPAEALPKRHASNHGLCSITHKTTWPECVPPTRMAEFEASQAAHKTAYVVKGVAKTCTKRPRPSSQGPCQRDLCHRDPSFLAGTTALELLPQGPLSERPFHCDLFRRDFVTGTFTGTCHGDPVTGPWQRDPVAGTPSRALGRGPLSEGPRHGPLAEGPRRRDLV
jgi:hypothetical protein